MRRCPFAPYGLASDLMAACPGFERSRVDMGDGPGAGLSGQTCCHVGTGTTTRGFAAICLHPEAGRVVTEARRIVRTPCASPAVRPSGRRRLSEGGRARSSPSRSRRTSTWAPSIAPVAERRR